MVRREIFVEPGDLIFVQILIQILTDQKDDRLLVDDINTFRQDLFDPLQNDFLTQVGKTDSGGRYRDDIKGLF